VLEGNRGTLREDIEVFPAELEANGFGDGHPVDGDEVWT